MGSIGVTSFPPTEVADVPLAPVIARLGALPLTKVRTDNLLALKLPLGFVIFLFLEVLSYCA